MMKKRIKRAAMDRPLASALWMASALLLGLILCADIANAQDVSSNVQITSPPNGSVFAPGDSIPIVVSLTSASPTHVVGVIGEGIGFSSTTNVAPYTFSLTLPNSLCGPKKLTAYELTSPGIGVFSAPVIIDVEPKSSLNGLRVTPTVIALKFPGAQLPLRVVGSFEDGVTRDVTKSSRVTYISNDPIVVSVSTIGLVTARGNGPASTRVEVSYEGSSSSIPVSIAAPVPFGSFAATIGGLSSRVLRGTFSLGVGSDGINPTIEPVTIQIGARQITIPANSFTEDERGRFRVAGTFEETRITGWIAPIQDGQFEFRFEMSGFTLSLTTQSARITVIVGDDGGETTVALLR